MRTDWVCKSVSKQPVPFSSEGACSFTRLAQDSTHCSISNPQIVVGLCLQGLQTRQPNLVLEQHHTPALQLQAVRQPVSKLSNQEGQVVPLLLQQAVCLVEQPSQLLDHPAPVQPTHQHMIHHAVQAQQAVVQHLAILPILTLAAAQTVVTIGVAILQQQLLQHSRLQMQLPQQQDLVDHAVIRAAGNIAKQSWTTVRSRQVCISHMRTVYSNLSVSLAEQSTATAGHCCRSQQSWPAKSAACLQQLLAEGLLAQDPTASGSLLQQRWTSRPCHCRLSCLSHQHPVVWSGRQMLPATLLHQHR